MSRSGNRHVERTARWVLHLTAWALVATLFATRPLSSAQVDTGTPDPILKQFGPKLDKGGGEKLDFRAGWPTGGPIAIPHRPVLAPLLGFPSAVTGDDTKPWMKEVALTRARALLAYRKGQLQLVDPADPSLHAFYDQIGLSAKDELSLFLELDRKGHLDALGPNTPKNAKNFFQHWLSAPREKRVFISFTSQDAAYADKIKRVLSEKYVVFVFKTDFDNAPLVRPSAMGLFFDSAGNHYVVDSANARASEGVFFESKLLATLDRPARAGPRLGEIVDIYGRMNCSETHVQLLKFENEGATVTYFDVDASPKARAQFDKMAKAGTLPLHADGTPILPVVIANGQVVPIQSTKGCLDLFLRQHTAP